MGFDRGSASFRMMEMPRAMPENWAERFAERAAGPLELVKGTEERGWVTGRHLLDTNITEESATLGGWVYLVLRRAIRKVPAGLLRAECQMDELAVMAAEGKARLKAEERSEIKKQAQDRLLPKMPPTLKGLPFLHRRGTLHLYTGALSEDQTDAIGAYLQETLGFTCEPSTPELLAEAKGIDAEDLAGTCFSPEMAQMEQEPSLGREFLTWLWHTAETQNGKLDLSDGRELGLLVEGPLTFQWEGNGAHVTQIRRGAPEQSAEAKVCLLAGKKLRQAKFTMALDEDRIWSFVADADEFTFRAMKFPQGEGGDRIARFQERMQYWDEWREMWLDLYGQFLALRAGSGWRKVEKKMREWVSGRPARR